MNDDLAARSATPKGPANTGGRDFSALTGQIDHTAVHEFRRRAKAAREPWAMLSPSTLMAWILIPVMVIIFLIIGTTIFVGFMATKANEQGGSSGSDAAGGMDTTSALIGLAILVIVVVVIVRLIRNRPAGSKWDRWYRLFTFAAANDLSAHPHPADPQYPGSIFSLGRDRGAYDRMQSVSGRFLDIGNYRYTTGSEDDEVISLWGFMTLKLDRRLPHMVLDARSNNARFSSNLPVSFSKDQTLSLEGDFDHHFTLYCPEDYQRDALYLFTPDLMALLIDNAGAFDVEIVEDWLFVYSTGSFDMTDEATMRRLFQIVDTVGAKTLSQSERYRDERMVSPDNPVVGPSATGNLVGAGGARLARRSPWSRRVIKALIIVGIAALMILLLLGQGLGWFSALF